LTNIANY